MLELRLFGTGQALYGGSSVPGFPGQQPHLLLCYLLLNRGKSHHREHLAAVFWGQYPTATARKYLRNALWRLRHAFEAVGADVDTYLQVRDGSIRFDAGAQYWLDVEAFEGMVEQVRDVPGTSLRPEQAADLAEAVELYAGDLLEGVYEDWCIYEQERFHLLFLSVLNKLMAFHGKTGNYERGLAYGERLLASDETREKVHRQMMRLYWLLGDRNDALAQYRRCAQILQEALGVSPAERTQRLYEQMKDGTFDPDRWAVESTQMVSDRGRADGSSHAVTEEALYGVRRMRRAVEHLSDELNALERQLSAALRRLV